MPRLMEDIERACWQMQQDLRYPLDPGGRVMLLNHLHPDLVPCIVNQLCINRGWEQNESNAILKPRKVIGSVFEDLVAWVPMSDPDDPIVAPQPKPQKLWSVGPPKVNDIVEKRPQE